MKLYFTNILCLLLVVCCCSVYGQPLIHLKSRAFVAEQNILSFNYTSLAAKNDQFEHKSFVIIQFNKILNEAEKQQLKKDGVELQRYVPENAFTAIISGNINSSVLQKANAISIFELTAPDKLSTRLSANKIPAWAIKSENTIDVIVHFNAAVTSLLVKNYFIGEGYSIIDDSWKDYHFITIRINRQKILQLAAIGFVEYIEPVAPAPKNFNYVMRANTRANVLNADPSAGGEGLKGQGVTIGIGDDADPTSHVDLRDRVINRAAGPQNVHGTHVTGIAAGGGIKDPLFQGVAPLATIVSQLFNGIFLNAASYIADYRMVVTNNSWGNITGECDLSGVYDTYSKLMDDISIQYPFLLNVFAAGNDGPYTCLGFPQQYHTIVSGHQSAKNVLSVAWGEKNQTVSISSSIGPTADGRMKPEITSQGSGVQSTAPNNSYFTDWGTSMAAPTVAGGAALLIEKFRQMNGGIDPKSGLIKALLMNGAKDIENPAPDYKSGYGFLNLVRSLDMVKNNHFFTSSVLNASVNNQVINVPAGLAQLKVMVYWHDPSAAIFAQNSLVNDIDMEVATPSSTTILPWVLNGNNTNANANATRGTDHINNSEQVTIDEPAAGNYTIKIKGTAINTGASQEYFVVYDYVPKGVDLTYPSVGEPFLPGEPVVINWDSWGDPQNTFTLQYSLDAGLNWITIDANIPSAARQYNWSMPSVVTDKAKLRLLKNGTSFTDESQPFVIIDQPTVSLAPVQCEDYINLTWNTIPGATDYEVMMKKGVVMASVTTTNATSYIFSGLNRDSTYWLTVRPRINNKPGRRAVAINRKPDNGSCAGSISDNDLKIDSILTPSAGRKFTSSEITANNISIRIKNLDDAPVTGFTVKYSINGAPFTSNNVSATIAPNSTYVYTFAGVDFSAAANYNIIAVVKNNAADNNPVNDTATKLVKQLPNPPLTLPYIENFDAAPPFEIIKDTMGLPALDKWDFTNTTDFGRVRSFVNTGIAKSGNRAVTLDVFQYVPSGNTNYFTGTFNLSNYNLLSPADAGLILEFSYKHHGQMPHPDNRVWVRRSDTDSWVEVFNFDSIPLQAGEWKTVSVNLAKTAAAINPTSSFQIRFGQHGSLMMGDNITSEGITIDDIKLFSAPNDVALIGIENPVVHSCGLSNNADLKINYKINKTAGTCIAVKYQLDGGAIINECAPAGSGTYTFANKLNLSTPGPHSLNVWVDDANDNYRGNDSIINFIIYSNPVITSFPYNENFENGTGFWHTEGYKSSWQYGMPASLKINKAASGTKAWKTSLRGQYNELEESYLYSPCFDISSLVSPYLSFQIAMDIEQCGQFICDKAWLEYSTDGKSWNKLGSYGEGINWYNKPVENVWDSSNFTQWHMAGIGLPKGLSQLQLRFVMKSDAGVSREGLAIDDVQIFDKQVNSNNIQWQLYPNPANSFVQLLSNHETGKTVSITMFNAAGQIVFIRNFIATGFLDINTINVNSLAKGVYAVKVTEGTNTKIFKLVKQ